MTCKKRPWKKSMLCPLATAIVVAGLSPFVLYAADHRNDRDDTHKGSISSTIISHPSSTQSQKKNISKRKTQTNDSVINTTRGGRLILHIGPPKTASTTLQDDLGTVFSQILLQDGWLYLGKRKRQQQQQQQTEMTSSIQEMMTSRDCQRELQLSEEDENENENKMRRSDASCWSKVRQELKRLQHHHHHHQEQQNVILSEEGFVTISTTQNQNLGPLWVKRLAQTLLPHWNVFIVAVYRHYEAAVLSDTKYYNTHRALGKSWTTHTRSMWATLQKALKERRLRHARNKNNNHGDPQSSILSLYRDFDDSLPLWRDHFGRENVILLNIENDTEYITCQFLCHPIMFRVDQSPQSLETTRACLACRQHVEQHQQQQPQQQHHKGHFRYMKQEKAKKMDPSKYDPILVEAARRGIINATIQQSQTKGQVRQEYERLAQAGRVLTWQQMPLVCPPQDEILALWQESWRYEQAWMLPAETNDELVVGVGVGFGGIMTRKNSTNSTSTTTTTTQRRRQQMEAAHRASFQRLVDDSYFCDVNVKQILNGVETWDEFLMLRSKQPQPAGH